MYFQGPIQPRTTPILLPQPPKRDHLLYFCDESSQNSDRYLAVGGIAVNRNALPTILERLKQINEKHDKKGETKWNGAKSWGGRVHKDYIDLLFEMAELGRLHFHIRFSEMSEYDHKLSGPRRRIDTVSKAFYQLLLHRPVCYYRDQADVFIFPDDGECTAELPGKIGALRNEQYKWGGYEHCAVKCIEPRQSHREPMLQLLDCTLGALTAYKNGRHEDEQINKVKRDLAEHAFKATGWKSLDGYFDKDDRKLNLWNVKPSIKVERGPAKKRDQVG